MTEKQVALLPERDDLNPIQLLSIAVQKGVDAEQLKALMELQREWKAEQARDAFVTAMNAFRAEALKVFKTKQVSFGSTSYKHATLANIVEVAAPALSRHGLSHRWETNQDGGLVTVACIITHQFGHSERTALSSAPDTSGAKNAIQAVGSAVSYLQRYTFMAITGLAAQDQAEDDGAATGPIVDGPIKLSPKRLKELAEGMLAAVAAKDRVALTAIYDPLSNDERQALWANLRSYERTSIKALLSNKALPDDLDIDAWAVTALNGAKDGVDLQASWVAIQDAYAERDQEVPADIDTCYQDRKQLVG